jgi:hypothetical protein
LAKKLKYYAVFGASSDEYLNYTIKKRQEWETRGMEIVDELVESVKRKSRDCFDKSNAEDSVAMRINGMFQVFVGIWSFNRLGGTD